MHIHNGIRYRDEDAERLGFVKARRAAADKAVREGDVEDRARRAGDGDRARRPRKAARGDDTGDDDVPGAR